MKWKVFYNSSCALQNYENLLVTASKDEGAALEFCECTEVSDLERGSLYLDEQGELMFIGAPLENPIRFSWEQSLHFWSKEKMSFKKHPLLRALGAPAGQWVVDATCGMAGDTTFLLNAGLNVRAFERFFPTYLLLSYSLLKETQEGLIDLEDRLELYHGSYSASDNKDHWNCPIYFDPMFDDGVKRKAKSNKEMSLFHSLLKDYPDDSTEVAKALFAKTNRLVIKRAPKGPLLLERPNSQWTTKAVRFDLYI